MWIKPKEETVPNVYSPLFDFILYYLTYFKYKNIVIISCYVPELHFKYDKFFHIL